MKLYSMMAIMERVSNIVADTGCMPLWTVSPSRRIMGIDACTYDIDLYIHSRVYYDESLCKVKTFTMAGDDLELEAIVIDAMLDHVYPYLACNSHLVHPASDCYERHFVRGEPIGEPEDKDR